MSLIKCQKCGQMVSETATTCPNCSTLIEKSISGKEPIEENKIPSASNAINNPPENPLVQPPPHTQIQNEPQQQSTPHPNYQTAPTSYYGNEDKRSPFVFAILAIFFGWLGIHLFYINKKQAAVFVLAINLFAIFLLILSMIPFLGLLVFIFFPYLFLLIPIGMISWIQAIIALVITEDEFERRFVKKNTILPF